MKTNFKNFQNLLKIYKRKGDTTQMKNNKKDTFVSKTGETPEEQNKFLITKEMMKGQSEEVKNFLRETNKILKEKSIEAREIFLKDLQKNIDEDLKGSDSK